VALGKIKHGKIFQKDRSLLMGVDKLNSGLSVVEGIALGEQAMREGRVHSQAEAKRHFAKWL
jgi:hypothetical protein